MSKEAEEGQSEKFLPPQGAKSDKTVEKLKQIKDLVCHPSCGTHVDPNNAEENLTKVKNIVPKLSWVSGQDASHKLADIKDVVCHSSCVSEEGQRDDLIRIQKIRMILYGHFIISMVGLILLFFTLVIAGITIGRLLSVRGSNERDCSDDKFNWLSYQSTSNEAKSIKYRFVKYKNVINYNFNDANEACKNLSSTLWYIQDGEQEWKSVIEMAKKEDKAALWLNGKISSTCQNGEEECLKEEAALGKGLAVTWPMNSVSTYSRLYVPAEGDRQCISVTKSQDFLWTSSDCTRDTAHSLCVKRDCKKEN